MKKWFKFLIIGAVLVVGVVAFSAKLFISKEFLVEEVEKSINSRIQIGTFDVSLLAFPARITLTNVILAERDNSVERNVPYSERNELTIGAVELDEVTFELSLWELLSKKIYVDSFELDGLHANVTLFEDGTNSLDPLFAEPLKEEDAKKSPKSFNAKKKEEFVTQLDSIKISNVSFDLLIEKTGLFAQGSECGIELSDIQVNPNSLEIVNEAKIKWNSKVELFDSKSKTIKFGELGLSGDAQTKLFDPVTGDIDPEVQIDFSISDDSYISTDVPYIQKVWSYGRKLEKVGVKLGTLPDKATFGRSKKFAGSYKRGRVDIEEDISIVLHDWEIAVNEHSWLESGSENHEFYIDISASEKSSQSMVKHLDSLLKSAPREVRGELEGNLKNQWLVGGKLTLKLHTKGKLSGPKIAMLTELPDVESLIKDFAKKSALDFMMKQFGGKK